MTRARNSANLASHGNLFVDIANDRTGIGSVVPAQNLHVAGTAGFHADVTFTGDLYNTTWDRSDNSLNFVDGARLKLGTSQDLELYHNGTNSHIRNNTGSLIINGSEIYLMSHQGTPETYFSAVANGAASLYHNNVKKFETTAYGTNTTGTAVNDGLVVAGVATVTTMNVTGVLTYDDVTSVDSIGIITARSNIDCNGDLDVDGHTNLDNVSIVGIATVTGSSQINFGGGTTQLQISNSNDSDINHNESNGSGLRLRVNGQTQMVVKTDSITYGTNVRNYYTDRIATHASDIDTEIRFPANDTISFETAGNESFRIDSIGRLLHGTTSSLIQDYRYRTQIQRAGSNALDSGILGLYFTGTVGASAHSVSTAIGFHKKESDGSALSNGGGIGILRFNGFDGSNYVEAATIEVKTDGNVGTNDMPGRIIFSTTADGASSPTERLRIDSSGRVMIGTTTEGRVEADDLTIATSGSTGITLRSGAGNAGNIMFSDGTSGDDEMRGTIQYHHLDNSMRFFTNATRKLTIDSSGRVLIGTTSATSLADELVVATSGDCGITIMSGTTHNGRLYFSDSGQEGDGFVDYDHQFGNLKLGTRDTTRFTIDSSGRVGVNQSSFATSDTMFSVTETSGHCEIGIISKNDSAAVINLGDTDSYNQGRIKYDNSDNSLTFRTVGTDRVRIDSSGRLLVGAAAIQYHNVPFYASGTGPVIGAFHSSSGGTNDQARIALGALANNPPYNRGVYLTAENNGAGHDFIVSCSASHAAGPSDKLRIKSDGNVGIGSDIPSKKLDVSGNIRCGHFTIDRHGQPTIMMTSTSDTGGGAIYFGSPASGVRGGIIYDHNNDNLKIRNIYGTSIEIDNSRKSTFSGDIHGVHDGLAVNIFESNNNHSRLRIRSGDSSLAQLEFANQSDADAGEIRYDHTNDNMTIHVGNNAERLRITSGGKILFGNHSNDRGAQLQYEGSEHSCIGIHRNVANHGSPAMVLSASRGTSAGSNTIVQHNDYLGMFTFKGTDGSDLATGAYITAIVDATPGNNDMPTRLGFWTSPDGSQTPQESMRITKDGYITKPRQAMFEATGNNVAFAAQSPLPYPNISYNIGGCYNASTYKFTAPLDGYYQVMAHVIPTALTATNSHNIELYVIDNHGTRYFLDRKVKSDNYGNNNFSVGGTRIIYADTGDTLWLQFHSISGTPKVETASYFSIMLVA